tara:strand:- start:1223 stop:1369 length:147 start_codon:yes stop_codon:yes gene_type:complete
MEENRVETAKVDPALMDVKEERTREEVVVNPLVDLVDQRIKLKLKKSD